MKNDIFLRRQSKVIVKQGSDILPPAYVASMLKNIEALGFTASTSLIDRLLTLPFYEFMSFYEQLLLSLKRLVGAHVKYKPMYPNFPNEVMQASEAELYINAVVHYLTGILPNSEKQDVFPLFDNTDLRIIDLGTDEEFDLMMRQLIGANTSLSQTDRADIEWSLINLPALDLLPAVIPQKENAAFVSSVLIKTKKLPIDVLSSYFKTATDVLRLATALSDGDISLSSPTLFKKFSRFERRSLLQLLESTPNVEEDMFRYKVKWIRLGEILHPGEYKHRFPHAAKGFDAVRNHKRPLTFYSKLEKALEQQDVSKAVSLLEKRPGDFARRIDHLLRLSTGEQETASIIVAFATVAHHVSTPVLLQLYSHMKHRHRRQDLRVVFPKGNVSKVMALDNPLPSLRKNLCDGVRNACKDALHDRFAKLPPLGNVWLDERLREQTIPFSQRSNSKTLKTISRGSKLTIPEGDTLRFFIWWKEGFANGEHTGSVDIDLSAGIYDENWQYKEHISYTNLSSKSFKAFHSGDITSAPNGACEFIDLHIPTILKKGGRYILMNVYSFSVQPFVMLPECFGGWMMRQHIESGEIFEPSTVQNKIDLASDSTISIPLIFDLQERKLIWTDISLHHHVAFENNLEQNNGSVSLIGKAMTKLLKPTLYDLFSFHAEARGILIYDKQKADTIYSLDEGVTPYDIETIIETYLT
ncbi:cytoplasmic protein [Priestia aryabhattai]|uniref:cytoplasmic protein n=1 Tax=Priestia aryabhattai TaxID=412384 RepID=UPI00398E8756